MNFLMLHDIRSFDNEFFPKRYRQPYFLTPDQFDNIVKNYPGTNYDQQRNNRYVYTFDDGLVDHLFVARLLSSKGIKCIFFVPRAPVIDRKIVDSHKIQFLLAAADEVKLYNELHSVFQKEFDITANDLDHFTKSKWANNIWSKEMVFVTRIFREFGSTKERSYLLDFYFKKYVSQDMADFANAFYLSEDNVNEISAMGHLIGGHGDLSVDLRYCDSKEIESEISKSKEFLEQYNRNDLRFAYANGGYTAEVVHCMQKHAFNCAFTTNINDINVKMKHYKIARIDPTRNSFSKFN